MHTHLPTQEEIDSCLQACYLSKNDVEDFLDAQTIVICSHMNIVFNYNYVVLQQYFATKHIVEVSI